MEADPKTTVVFCLVFLHVLFLLIPTLFGSPRDTVEFYKFSLTEDLILPGTTTILIILLIIIEFYVQQS